MTDKKAIKILKNYHNGYFGYKIDEVHEAHNLAIKAIEEKIWIPTSEMLPEKYDSYLVMWRSLTEGYPDRLFYEICEYDPEEDEWERIEQAGEAGAEIVAWMPLPERYEPKEKENG